MRIRATDEQVSKMCALAVQASAPMGMGFLHFDTNTVFTPEDFPIKAATAVYLDYVQGRMVKLGMRRGGPDIWDAPDQISGEYESWIVRYPSYELAEAAGAEVI
jgi:hypothetical protein